MKKSILFLLLIAAISAEAQNYQTVYSHRTSLFADSYGNVKSMRIDSVKFNGDSILYPLKNIQQLDFSCLTPYGASWLGNKIIIHKAWNYFLNKDNDTIRIKTDAKLHESWTLFSRSDIIVEGNVYSCDTLSFLGVVDSVKTIKLSAYGFGASSAKYPFGEIKLSKRFGIIKTYSFLDFPSYDNLAPYTNKLSPLNLAGMTNPALGVQNLTWFDVYDFQVGDEIHIVYTSMPALGGGIPSNFKFKTETVFKYLSRQNYVDSIKYLIDFKQLVNNVEFTHYTSTEVIRQNNEFNIYPEVPIINGSYCDGYYSMFIGESIRKNSPYVSEQMQRSNETCWHTILADGCFPNYSYTKGLGGPYYWCWGIMGDSEEQSLVYYQKGTKKWGVPLLITGMNQPETKQNNTIYPNPVTDKIHVSSDILSEPCTFELLDLKGSVLIRTQVSSDQNTIHLSGFANGLYLYRISNNGVMIKSGKVVKQ